MIKIHKYISVVLLASSFHAWSECADESNNKRTDKDITILEGSLELSEKFDITFESATSNKNNLEFQDLKVTSCENSSAWSLVAEQATYNDEEESLTIENTKLKVFDLPIFWLGEVTIDDSDSVNVPNFGITDSKIDISYKFKNKTENTMFVLEPIYAKSSFGASMNFDYEDDENYFSFQTLGINDDDKSWVYDIDANINLTNSLSLNIDYSDFSGESLIQTYGHKYLDTNRRSLDLEQTFGLNFLYKNRSFSLQSTNYANFSFLRPISSKKDFFLYERFFKFDGWNVNISSEYARFTNNLLNQFEFPFEQINSANREVRDIDISRSVKTDKLSYIFQFFSSFKTYDFNNGSSSKELESSNYVLKQEFSFTDDGNFKIGGIWSNFNDQVSQPLLDSYPINPSPESNISVRPWVGKDRDANFRKIYIYKKGMNKNFMYSISTNLYEKYNYDQESMIFKKFFNKKPLFFSLMTRNKKLNFYAMGNYSYEKSKFLGLMAGVRYSDDSTKFSLGKSELVPSSFPLKPLHNYVLKFKKDFDSFSIFSRAQYEIEDGELNESILGVEWSYDCLRLRFSFEKAKFFPNGLEVNDQISYMQNIYLTNPAVKNNLSFEFELIGLTNVLTPIDNIIENGLFN